MRIESCYSTGPRAWTDVVPSRRLEARALTAAAVGRQAAAAMGVLGPLAEGAHFGAKLATDGDSSTYWLSGGRTDAALG